MKIRKEEINVVMTIMQKKNMGSTPIETDDKSDSSFRDVATERHYTRMRLPTF
jgi:hypothetical protein